jgi:hypothetical protein
VTVLIIFLCFAAFLAIYTITPFLDKSLRKIELPQGYNEKQNLLYQKEEVLGAIQDLEYDYTMKKMTEADYLQQKEKLIQEAVELLKKLDKIEEPETRHAADSAGNKHAKVRS